MSTHMLRPDFRQRPMNSQATRLGHLCEQRSWVLEAGWKSLQKQKRVDAEAVVIASVMSDHEQ